MRCEDDGKRVHYQHNKAINELWEEDKNKLLTLPKYEFSVFKIETARINKYGFVTFETNKYSVLPELYGQNIGLKIFFDKIEIYYDHALLKTYKRCYGTREENIDFTDYLNLLTKKPNAVEDTKFFDQLPKLFRKYISETNGKERKTALELLLEISNDGNLWLCDDIFQLAQQNGKTDSESIRQYYYVISKQEFKPSPIEVSDVPILNYNPDLNVYDTLTENLENLETNKKTLKIS